MQPVTSCISTPARTTAASCGTGQVPWPEIFAALADVGYEGWVVVESFNAVIAELAGATCVWRPLAESPETLARESLAFLRRYL